jgi:hypothetical protein
LPRQSTLGTATPPADPLAPPDEDIMRISVRALAFTFALLWGGSLAFAGLIHLAVPSYGTTLLDLASSIYPGFHGARSFGDALVGIGWGLADGAGGGLFFGWLYNLFVGRPAQAGHPA